MDASFFKKSKKIVLFFLVFSAIVIPVFYQLLKVEERVKIYNPVDFNPQLVDFSLKHIKKNHTIGHFNLINQNGEKITEKDYEGKIYVADFFFTRCKTICITMAYNMGELQEIYKNDDDILFLSHSVTPTIDSVTVLKKYALDKGAIDGKWQITTGNKKHIYELARKNYFAVLDHGAGDENDFIHTENFVLVDKEKRIRGVYDGTSKKAMQKLIKDIDLVKEEYRN